MAVRPDSIIGPVGAIDAAKISLALRPGNAAALANFSASGNVRQLEAEVVSRAPDGQFIVKAGDTSYKVSLPDNTLPGQKVLLQLSLPAADASQKSPDNSGNAARAASQSALPSATPTSIPTAGSGIAPGKPDTSATLTPAGSGVGAPLRASASAALTASSAYQAQTPQTTGESSITSLSQISRLITTVLQQSLSGTTDIKGTEALASHPAALIQTETIAAKLQQQVSGSGLFYESHLAAWSNGQLAKEQLQKEPQAHLPLLTQDSNGQVQALNKEVLQIVQQQLQTLDNQQIRWTGELLPGQRFDWQLQREQARPEHGGGAQQQAVPYWTSKVTINLPTLGSISAVFQLFDGFMNIRIIPAEPASAASLQDALGSFSSALQQAGVSCASLELGPSPADSK